MRTNHGRSTGRSPGFRVDSRGKSSETGFKLKAIFKFETRQVLSSLHRPMTSRENEVLRRRRTHVRSYDSRKDHRDLGSGQVAPFRSLWTRHPSFSRAGNINTLRGRCAPKNTRRGIHGGVRVSPPSHLQDQSSSNGRCHLANDP